MVIRADNATYSSVTHDNRQMIFALTIALTRPRRMIPGKIAERKHASP